MKYTYTAVISPDEKTGKYFCRVPDLPGCITSGKTLDEAIDMAAAKATDSVAGKLEQIRSEIQQLEI